MLSLSPACQPTATGYGDMQQETLQYNQVELDSHTRRYLEVYDDTSSWLAEILDGSMRTPFSFHFNGSDIIGRDGRALGKIFSDALTAAQDSTNFDRRLSFEVRRRQIEMDEYGDMVEMCKGKLPNTMVVLSDFPEELKYEVHDVGGYNTSRQQTMLRVICARGDGTVDMYSQSLDRSDRTALESIYSAFNVIPSEGELLGQRIHVDASSEDQTRLIDKLMGIYDTTLSNKFGGEWQAGRPQKSEINTYDFVRSQHDLLDAFAKGCLTHEGPEDLYGLAAAIKKRFENHQSLSLNVIQAISTAQGFSIDPYQEMRLAGEEAKSRGSTFSGCGKTLGNGLTNNDSEDSLEKSGYGNKEMKCVVCPFCRKTVDAIVTPKKISCPECKSEAKVQ
ncbi:MAG: hypothetical protein NVSMB46_05270 [Candidatus Saccharimonadales bacterium]